jgi:hypothetical protein
MSARADAVGLNKSKGNTMTQIPNPFGGSRPYGLQYEPATDTGIVSRFFNAVYGWMAAGLALTAVVAWYVGSNPAMVVQLGRGTFLMLMLVELGLVFAISAAINRISAPVATVLFLLYAALNGITLAGLVLIYTHAAIAGAFVVTAGMFGAMSFYGMVTRRDLSAFGSLLFMGLIGVVLASVVSMFWHNSLLQVAINYIGVLVFVGLTAYDTQRLKAIAYQTASSPAMAARLAINGALMLYLDFLNMFLFILSILNDRRR